MMSICYWEPSYALPARHGIAMTDPPDRIMVLGRPLRVGQAVLYAGYSSSSLRLAAAMAICKPDGRAEIPVRQHTLRASGSVLHYP